MATEGLADIITDKLFKHNVFSWGATLVQQDDTRAAYLKAEKIADKEKAYSFVRVWK